MFKDESGEIVPAIVTESLWEQANAVLKRRSEDVKNRQGICNHANLLTGKLYCTHCGTAYYRRDSVDKSGNKNSKWVCSGKIKNGANSCPSFAIYEDDIKPLLFAAFRDTEADAERLIDELVALYRDQSQRDDLAARIDALQRTIETIEKKKQKLLTFNALGELSDKDFISMNRQCGQELEAVQQELASLSAQQNSSADFKKHLDTIRRVLLNAQRDAEGGIISKEFVAQYIDKIYVKPEEDGSLRLQIKIFTGETTEQVLQNLRGRAGHTFKIMRTIFDFCDFEGRTRNVNIIIGVVFQDFQPRLFRVGEHKTCRFIGVKLDGADCVVDQIAVDRQQLFHLICARFELGKVDLAVHVSDKFFRESAADLRYQKLDVWHRLQGFGIDLDQIHPRL